ncbi:MAG: hypothetical protein KIS85_04600 [Anaerolineales bacterium]|nr:hypothetical protein [Anaerolineales bacterium]
MPLSKNAKLLSILLILVLASLACGSGSSVQVNQPESGASAPEQAQAQQVEPTAAPLGTTRSNPAPAGSEIVTDNMAFKVIGTVRPATDIVMSGNMFNKEPEAGQEYIFIEVQVTCQKTGDEQCSFYTSNFSVLGETGIKIDGTFFLAGVNGLLESTDFYGGATISGHLPFIVNQGDNGLLLVYDPFLGNAFYLAVE